jgi:hypothetical protein
MASPQRAARAADRIHRARLQLALARHALARVTEPGAPPVFVHADWGWEQRVVDRHRRRLTAVRGVVGVGLGYRRRAGIPQSERCAVIFVRRKKPISRLRSSRSLLPRSLKDGRGKGLPVDVVQIGRVFRETFVGESLGPSMDDGIIRTGTLGAFGVDADAKTRVAVTAMHVTGYEEYEESGKEVPIYAPSPEFGGVPSLLGYLVKGTTKGVDAAKIRLVDTSGTTTPTPQIGTVAGWRPAVHPADRGARVSMYGAVSRYQVGIIEFPMATMPRVGLDTVILARIASQPGDSGAALLDSDNLILGFLVGRCEDDDLRIFCPASLVLYRLGCDIPSAKKGGV